MDKAGRVDAGASSTEPVMDEAERHEAYVRQHGGYWADAASGPGIWVPASRADVEPSASTRRAPA